MATLKQRILELVAKRPGLTDREITDTLKGPGNLQQDVNQACRGLERQGIVARSVRPDGRLANYLVEGQTAHPEQQQRRVHDAEGLTEDFIKDAIDKWLRAQGWETAIAWGRKRGIDIVARRQSESWIIEAKGQGISPQAQGNYFLNGLSELLSRMDNPSARYSLAFPDLRRYQGLWERLPRLVKEKLSLSMLFVDASGTVRET
jgi:hypothetical protein